MNSKSLLYHLKYIFLHTLAFLLLLSYVFLITWTYCYSLFVFYLLISAFLACIIIFCVNKSKRQAIKFLLLGFFLFLILSPFNLKQYNRHAEALQKRIENRGELNTKEMLGVYGCLVMMTVFDMIPFPEVGVENFYLFFPVDGTQRFFHDNSILKSPSINRAIQSNEKGYIAWNKWNYVFNRDFRYSLAFDPCTVRTIKKEGHKVVILTTDFHYRENYVTIHANTFLRGYFAFRVDEGLFFYLQKKGWLHPYTAVWKAEVNN